jgi:hypothetical protein
MTWDFSLNTIPGADGRTAEKATAAMCSRTGGTQVGVADAVAQQFAEHC